MAGAGANPLRAWPVPAAGRRRAPGCLCLTTSSSASSHSRVSRGFVSSIITATSRSLGRVLAQLLESTSFKLELSLRPAPGNPLASAWTSAPGPATSIATGPNCNVSRRSLEYWFFFRTINEPGARAKKSPPRIPRGAFAAAGNRTGQTSLDQIARMVTLDVRRRIEAHEIALRHELPATRSHYLQGVRLVDEDLLEIVSPGLQGKGLNGLGQLLAAVESNCLLAIDCQ